MEGYRSIKKHKWKRQEKLLWFAVAIQSLLAIVLAVVALIMSMKTNTKLKDDQLERQFVLEDAKQMFEIDKLSTAKPKGINLPPVQASGHVLFLQSDVNDGPSFTNDHPVKIKLNVESYHRGVTVSEDGITMQYSGIYFIYSSVNYKLATANCSELSYQEWFHYIIKQNLIEDFKTTLLKSAYTCCEECSQIEETKYIAGQFYLESGDLITAMSSGENLIGGSQESSFLGLVMLISGQRVTR